MDDRQVEVVLSGSHVQPSLSSQHSCDPNPDRSSNGWLPVVSGQEHAAHKTRLQRRQEQDRRPRKHVSLCSSRVTPQALVE
jgi:hypothetical protein